MSWNVSDVTCELRLTPEDDQHAWRSLGNSVFRPPSIGPDGVRTSLKPDPSKAFILHRAAMKLDGTASKWQARLRIGR
jgi:hypothetical protein